jgi:hypothetical protein
MSSKLGGGSSNILGAIFSVVGAPIGDPVGMGQSRRVPAQAVS